MPGQIFRQGREAKGRKDPDLPGQNFSAEKTYFSARDWQPHALSTIWQEEFIQDQTSMAGAIVSPYGSCSCALPSRQQPPP